MNLATAIRLYAQAAGTASEGSSLTHPPGLITDTPKVRDIARRRLVKTNPDVDAKANPETQSDNSAFVGKPYRVMDKSYGHLISEHNSESSARHAASARPYSVVVGPNTTNSFQLQSNPAARNAARNKLLRSNPDLDCGGPGSGRRPEILDSVRRFMQNRTRVQSRNDSQILRGLGYKHQRSVKEGNVQADLYKHSLTGRNILLHRSGAWSSQKG